MSRFINVELKSDSDYYLDDDSNYDSDDDDSDDNSNK